ncbi:alpha/beta fold hydrolase [Plantactinospora sp. GCM10030261]|uniref:alpha/beta fold hydrolase n=1 Tax=Plantactinospora sp. GCM10030261 TaxID=3273420 RepID=UPI003609A454
MPYLSVGAENSGTIDLYYEDLGYGQPVVLIHGFPLSGAAWEKQVSALVASGHRVITYDRRGFGRSGQPSTGYDYDTFAIDLAELITVLDLRDVVLVGHSMGTGEVVRYLSAQGPDRISGAVLISPVPPYLLKSPDNPEGVDQSVFDQITQAIRDDRPAYLTTFLTDFYNLDQTLGKRISEEVVRSNWAVAVNASPIGTLACVPAWLTDFRHDLAAVTVPTLIIQGDADRILPIESTGKRLATMIANSDLVVIEGGSHGIPWTHADEINRELLAFIKG